MKANLLNVLKNKAALVLCAAALCTACSKDDDAKTEPEPAPATTPTMPQPADAFGVLAAVHVVVPSPVVVPGVNTDVNMGTGVAAFFATAGGGTYQDAGAISLNNTPLVKAENNAYTYTPDQMNPTGIDFSSGVSWSVAGSGSVPAINKTVAGGMPPAAKITSPNTITKASGYTFTYDPVSSGDSILFIISSANNTYVKKTKHRSATSCTFTAAELSGLANSDQALLQTNVYSISSGTYSGKKIYFVNQASHNVTGAKIQ